jgi:aminoglycoside 6'-N-acetyltransferase I
VGSLELLRTNFEVAVMAIIIRVLERGDESVFETVAQGVFDKPIQPALAREFLEDERHHIAVAVDDGCVVGFASGVDYIHPDKSRELWVNEVGVAPAHRSKGLGKAVLKALLNVGKVMGCRTAWVLTDRGNPGAMALYTSIGGTEGVDESRPSGQMVGYSFVLAEESN